MKFRIAEWDKDYHTVTDTETKEFKNRKEAEEYCKANKGGGYEYFIVNAPLHELEDYP